VVADRRPLLVVEHEASCPPGWVGQWLAEAGIRLEVRRPYVGEALPDGLSDHRGLLVLGGSAGAHDDREFPWLPDTRRLIRTAAAEDVPTLGICLGHQLAAVALGGAAHRNPAGQQIGVLDVGWLPGAAGDPLFGPLAGPRRAVQWNNDIVAVMPRGSAVLARAATGEVQAARFAARSWGVQWHPEAGGEIIREWAEEDRDDAVERGVDLDRYLEEVAAADEEMQESWRPLATGFAAVLASSDVTATSGRA
jgi:GMP synthase (glutamine-hydrolysing)